MDSKQDLLNYISEAHPMGVEIRFDKAADLFTEKVYNTEVFLLAKVLSPNLTYDQFMREENCVTHKRVEDWCRENRIDFNYEPNHDRFQFAKKKREDVD